MKKGFIFEKEICEVKTSSSFKFKCFQCKEDIIAGGPAIFIEEWDDFIHVDCKNDYIIGDNGMDVFKQEYKKGIKQNK